MGATHCCCTLQHTATHCNTLQPTATHCNPLQHTATHCNTPSWMGHAHMRCNTLDRTATVCFTLQHTCVHAACTYRVTTIGRLSNIWRLFLQKSPTKVGLCQRNSSNSLGAPYAVCCSCSVLQCVDNTLHRTLATVSARHAVAVCCSVLQCLAVCCSVLQCVVNTLRQHTATHCTVSARHALRFTYVFIYVCVWHESFICMT